MRRCGKVPAPRVADKYTHQFQVSITPGKHVVSVPVGNPTLSHRLTTILAVSGALRTDGSMFGSVSCLHASHPWYIATEA